MNVMNQVVFDFFYLNNFAESFFYAYFAHEMVNLHFTCNENQHYTINHYFNYRFYEKKF